MTRTLIVIALFGCGTPDIARGVCGNGIVEEGEDCDAPPGGQCEACGVRCDPTNGLDCLTYDPIGMQGFVCGADNFCHAPAGVFDLSVVTHTIPVEAYRITDVDNDRKNEVLVQSPTAVTALFGAATFTATQASVLTPIARGHAAFAQIDDSDPVNVGKNPSLDTLLPTADGIVAFTSPFGVPSPYPFPSVIPEQIGQPAFSHPVGIQKVGVLLGRPEAGPGLGQPLFYQVLDVAGAMPDLIGGSPVCNAKLDEVDTTEIQTLEVQPGSHLIAMTIRPVDDLPRVCIIKSNLNLGGTFDIGEVALVANGSPTSRPVLAKLRGAGCPSLVLGQNGQVVEYLPAGTGNNCAFVPGPIPFSGAPLGSNPIGTVPLVPPPLAGRSNVGIALTTGIYELELGPSALHEVYASDRPLHNVKTIDLDGDLDVDVVASSKNAEDLDILDRRPAVPPSKITFLRVRFDTAGTVSQFLLADFDGNEIPDVAFVENHVDNGLPNDHLKIAYGTSDQLLPGAIVGTFSSVLSIMPADIPDSGDPASVVGDIAVLFKDIFSGSGLALLHGSPQRTMLGFFDPRPQPVSEPSQFRGVVTGFFSKNQSGGNDVLAFEQFGATTRVYLSQAATSGQLDPSQVASNASDLVDCSTTPAGTNLCVDDAQFIAWPIVPFEHDVVLAIDSKLDVAMLDPHGLVANQNIGMTRWSGAIDAPPGSVVRKIQRIQLAEGGESRLLISLAPGVGADFFKSAAVNLCSFDAVSGPVCHDLTADISEALRGDLGFEQICVDAGLAHVSPTSRFDPPDNPLPDLLVLCRPVVSTIDAMGIFSIEKLYRVVLDETYQIRNISESLLDVRADEMQIGDVSGDGIDDLVFLDRLSAVPQLTVFRQCTSRDTACTQTSDAPDVPTLPPEEPKP